MKRLLVALVVLVASCGEPRGETRRAPAASANAPAESTNAPPVPSPTPPAPTPVPPAVVARRPVARADEVGSSRVVEHGCARVGPTRTVSPTLGAAAVLGAESGHLLAINEGPVTTVLSVSHDGRDARPLARLAMREPLAATQLVPPGLVRVSATRLGVATISSARRLTYRELDRATGAVAFEALLADGTADPRFPPTIALAGDLRLVAYALLGNPQRVEVIALGSDGRMVRRHDVTAPSGGAASPSFVPDVSPPVLVFVDPREALSLSQSVRFDATGHPGDVRSLQPIIGLATPARITAVQGATDLTLFFLAYGETSGVGVYTLEARSGSITPRALVAPSSGPRAWVDALGADFGAIAASLAPSTTDPSVRDVVVRLLDSAGIGSELRIPAAAGTLLYPAPSRDDEGHLAIVHGSVSGIELTKIACLGR